MNMNISPERLMMANGETMVCHDVLIIFLLKCKFLNGCGYVGVCVFAWE